MNFFFEKKNWHYLIFMYRGGKFTKLEMKEYLMLHVSQNSKKTNYYRTAIVALVFQKHTYGV